MRNFLKGFSSVELLVALGVLGILLAMVFVSFRGLRNTQTLNSAVEQLTIFIDKAKTETLSSKNSSSHGVHFESNRLVRFEGAVYDPMGPSNVELTLSPDVEISSITLNGGGADLVFQEFTGKTNEYGSIVVRLKHATSESRNIEFKSTGIIKIDLR